MQISKEAEHRSCVYLCVCKPQVLYLSVDTLPQQFNEQWEGHSGVKQGVGWAGIAAALKASPDGVCGP